jgi:hypothetical protein
MKRMQSPLSRRHTLQLIALALSGSAAGDLLAKDKTKVSSKMLQTAAGLVDADFSAKRLDMISPALQQNLDVFAMVRDLEIDDLIEPAPVFSARWR